MTTKLKQLTAYFQEDIKNLIEQKAAKENRTVSNYLKGIILKDLQLNSTAATA